MNETLFYCVHQHGDEKKNNEIQNNKKKRKNLMTYNKIELHHESNFHLESFSNKKDYINCTTLLII